MKNLFLISIIFMSGCSIKGWVDEKGVAHLSGYGAKKYERYEDGKFKSIEKYTPIEMPKLELDN